MTSRIRGQLVVPVWVDDDQVMPLVNDDGRVPILLDAQTGRMDVDSYGIDGATARQIVVDASGNTKVILAGQDADIEVTQTTPADLRTALHGNISSAWQKLGMVWGYSARIVGIVQDLSAAAGYNVLTSSTVPAGEIWVIHTIIGNNLNTAANPLQLLANIGGNSIFYYEEYTHVAAHWVIYSGTIVLAEGDSVSARFYGCTLNDDIFLKWAGYRMDIDL